MSQVNYDRTLIIEDLESVVQAISCEVLDRAKYGTSPVVRTLVELRLLHEILQRHCPRGELNKKVIAEIHRLADSMSLFID